MSEAVSAHGPGPSASIASVALDRVSFAYPRHGHRLTDVSLAIGAGELCCLLGPNGAGKTTLLRCLLNLLSPSRGSVRIAGQAVAGLSSRQLARLVAYVPQNTSTPFPFTALDVAVMGRTPYLGFSAEPGEADRAAARDRLDALGIGHLAGRSFPTLSGGERQLVLLARALVQASPVLLLDEPTSALDYGNELQILNIVSELAEGGKTVLMTTHQPSHALNYASRAVLMRNGAIVAEGAPDIVVTGDRLSALYGVPIRVASIDPIAPGVVPVRTCIPGQR